MLCLIWSLDCCAIAARVTAILLLCPSLFRQAIACHDRAMLCHCFAVSMPLTSSAYQIPAYPLRSLRSMHFLCSSHLCLCMAMHISAFPFLCLTSQFHASAFLNLASRFPLKACPCRAIAIQIPAVPWLFTGFLCRSRDSRIRRQSGPFPATQIYSVACHNLAELIRRNSVRCFSDFFPSETSLGCVPPAPQTSESSIIEPLTDCVHVTVNHAFNGELQLCTSCYRLGVCQ